MYENDIKMIAFYDEIIKLAAKHSKKHSWTERLTSPEARAEHRNYVADRKTNAEVIKIKGAQDREVFKDMAISGGHGDRAKFDAAVDPLHVQSENIVSNIKVKQHKKDLIDNIVNIRDARRSTLKIPKTNEAGDVIKTTGDAGSWVARHKGKLLAGAAIGAGLYLLNRPATEEDPSLTGQYPAMG